MRTDSHRLAGTLVALSFLAGWFSASWVSPPTAVTQTQPARPVVVQPDVPMPHIALEAVTAPVTSPASARNPFVFTDRPSGGRAALERRADAPSAVTGDGDKAAIETAPPAVAELAPPAWRVVGIAADATGHITAVVAGAGSVFLLGLGDRLPDGAAVVDIDAAGLVVATPAGERLALRLP